MGRKKRRTGWLGRILALLVLIGAGVAAWFWWDTQHWTPSEDHYPDQGALITSEMGAVNFQTLAALGADFAYLKASIGADGLDPGFGNNLDAASKGGLDIGAVHMFDPCVLADGQTANFVTVVPRTRNMLPPVVVLSRTAENCEKRVSDAAVESELMTLINQIENHAGKPVILKVEPEFEAIYGISGKLDRNLWVNRTRFAPTYASRPWLLWSANENLRSEAADRPIEWVVVQP